MIHGQYWAYKESSRYGSWKFVLYNADLFNYLHGYDYIFKREKQ